MISFKGKTFCQTDNCSLKKCHRHISNIDLKELEESGLDVCMSDYTKDCPAYEHGRTRYNLISIGIKKHG